MYEVQKSIKQWFSKAAGAFLEEVVKIPKGPFREHSAGTCFACIYWKGPEMQDARFLEIYLVKQLSSACLTLDCLLGQSKMKTCLVPESQQT